MVYINLFVADGQIYATEIYINQLIQENIGLMERPKLSKHDRYVLELSDKIKHDYDSISTNVLLRHSKRSLGEIDIVAKKGNRLDLYEVKCSYRIVKARKQLKRIKKHLNLENVRSYFYCGNSNVLVTV